MSSLPLNTLLKLAQVLDDPTTRLLARFITTALSSGDPSAYVRAAIESALDGNVVVIDRKERCDD